MTETSPSNSMEGYGAANTTVLLALIAFYIHWKCYSSSNATLGFLKGKLRSVCGLLLQTSILSTLAYTFFLNFLSTKFNIDKIQLEISRALDEQYKIDYKNHSIDLVGIMIYSLRASEILFVSSIFLALSLLIPEEEEFYEKYKLDESLVTFNSSILSFCRLWGIFRIPILLYGETLRPFMNGKVGLFCSQVFYNLELLLGATFLILIKFRNYTPWARSNVDIGLFATTVTAYGISKYGINLIDFPFELTRENLNLINSLQFGIMIAIYLYLAEIMFPRKKQQCEQIPGKRQNTHREIQNMNEVALLETVIEFEDKKDLIAAKFN